MARCIKRLQRSPFHLKYLPVFNLSLPVIRLVFIDSRLRTDAKQIRDPVDMVMMPMRDQGFMHGGLFVFQYRLEQARPPGHAFAGVDEKPTRAASDEICICSWKCLRFSTAVL